MPNSALTTDFLKYVSDRHGFILSRMTIKFSRITQGNKSFQMIPQKPSLDEKKIHRVLSAKVQSGRDPEPDMHGGPKP